tara:strand:- start:5078 stop:6550 length:1473 start_codon:yes stop_codon:yes gene_type:complete
MVELQHYQFIQVLTIAKALQLRGAEIKVLICDQSLPGCEIKSSSNKHLKDPCWECKFNKANIFDKFGLDMISYTDVINVTEQKSINKLAQEYSKDPSKKILYKNFDLTRCVDDSITRYFYGGDAANSAEYWKIRGRHIETAIKNALSSQNIDQDWKPDAVLCNMSAYSIWSPIYEHFRDRIKMVSALGFNHKAIAYNFNDIILSRDRFNQYYKSRDYSALTEQEKSQLELYFRKRFSGEDWLFKKDGFFNISDEKSEIKDLKIDTKKRNIFLFSNLYWDTGLSDKTILFDDVISWVLATIEMVKGEKNLHLYIKTHPAEKYSTVKSRKTVKNIIEQHYPKGIENVTIIDPARKIRPYSLFPFIDVAVLFQGTLGLELLKAGIPVISCAIASYNSLGFVHEPSTLSEYKKTLLSAGKIRFDEELLEVFLYFFFMRAVAFPWELSSSSRGNNIYHPLNIRSSEDLKAGNSEKLDYLCDLILGDEKKLIPENW